MSEMISKELTQKWKDAGYIIENSYCRSLFFMTRMYGQIEKQIEFYDDKSFDIVCTDSNFDRVSTKECVDMTELALINETVKELGWV